MARDNDHISTTIEPAAGFGSESSADSEASLEDEVLIEEISIDGMCGVY
ncbi:MAG TPA: mycofactocin precursor [Acidimicrobiaceae bacterium]|jgi:mycofactocin precursor|nr:mycofactocin precursor [Acidimicrobiaceae bacterium]